MSETNGIEGNKNGSSNCLVCGRGLRSEKSKLAGMGPVCARKQAKKKEQKV